MTGKIFNAILLLLAVSILPLHAADSDRMSVPSPDGKWSWEAEWITTKNNSWGYSTWLVNKTTGKIYGKDDSYKKDPGSFGPQRVSANWSGDGKYVAVYFYYGRALIETVVYFCDKEPRWVKVPHFESDDDMRSMLAPADRPFYQGWNRVWRVADRWENNTDLSLTMTVRIFLQPRKGRDEAKLVDFDHNYTVRFSGAKARVIRRDKLPADY